MTLPDHVPPAPSSASPPPRPPAPAAGLFAPLHPARSLSTELIERFSRDIIDGTLAPGSRLPTEQQLGAALGVSRTVVREAMAALRGEGLVIARQGAGVFVAEHDHRRPFRIDPNTLSSLTNMLALMELRTGLESEAAGLAAQRRDGDDLRRLDLALAALEQAAHTGTDAAKADVDFHGAIMVATHNPYYVDFLRYLGQFIMRGRSVRAMAVPPGERAKYLQRVQSEHRAIRDAIVERDEAAARKAAQHHLRNSRKRYGRLREAVEKRAAADLPGI